MKVVLDTNVWLSAIFWKGESYKIIKILEKKNVKIINSEEILNEIIEVLNKESKFQKFIKDRKLAIEELLRTVVFMSLIIKPQSKLNVITEHLEDNKILEVAVDGRANYLISYDNHLLKLRKYKNIKILTPSEFLKEITSVGNLSEG